MNRLDSLGQIESLHKKDGIGSLEVGALIGGETGSFESHGIEPHQFIVFDGHAERGDILADAGEASDHGKRADAAVLMNDGSSPEKRPILNLDISAQKNAVDHDDMVAKGAVMPHVAVSHEEIIVSDDRGGTFSGSSVDGDVFPDFVSMAQGKMGNRTAVCEVLWGASQDTACMNLVLFSKGRMSREMTMGADDAACSDPNMFVNDGVGANPDIGTELGRRVDDRGGMDERRIQWRSTMRGGGPNFKQPANRCLAGC